MVGRRRLDARPGQPATGDRDGHAGVTEVILDAVEVEELVVGADGGFGVTVVFEAPLAEEQHARTEQPDGVHGVADHDDGGATMLQFAHAVEALELEGDVAHGQHFVEQQDLGLDMDGDREAQPHVHARRVELHRRIDEVAYLGELDDLVEALGDLFSGQAQQHAVHVDVFPTRHLLVEAHADAEQRGHPADDAHHAFAGRRTRRPACA